MCSWLINQQSARRSALALGGFAIILVGAVANRLSDTTSELLFSEALVLSAVAALIATLTFAYYKSITRKKIVLSKGSLKLPRMFWGYAQIDLNEVASLEILGEVGRDRTIVFIRELRQPVAFSSKLFVCDNDANEFFDLLVCEMPLSGKIPITPIRIFESLSDQRSTIFACFFMILVYLFISSDALRYDDVISAMSLRRDIFSTAEFYRVFSGFFLHVDAWHLTLNVLFLAIVGRAIENIAGGITFWNIFFLSAFVGSLVSLAVGGHDQVVGMSGGVLGLFGAYIIFYLRDHKKMMGSKFPQRAAIVICLVTQMTGDVIFENVDAASHAGGFLLGVIFGIGLVRSRSFDESHPASACGKFIASIVLFLYLVSFAYALSRAISV